MFAQFAQLNLFGSDHHPIYLHHVSSPHHSHKDAQENHQKKEEHHHHARGKHASEVERQRRTELEKLPQHTTQEKLKMKELQRQMEMGQWYDDFEEEDQCIFEQVRLCPSASSQEEDYDEQEKLKMKELQRQMEMGQWHDDFEEEDQLIFEQVRMRPSASSQEEDYDELEFTLPMKEIVLNNYIPVSTLSSHRDRDVSSINLRNKKNHHCHIKAQNIQDQALSKSQEKSKQLEEISNQKCNDDDDDDDDDAFTPPHIIAISDEVEDADEEDEDLDSIWRSLNGSSDTIESYSSYDTA